MLALKRAKENTVCPNVFTTGTPRIYSTASLFISISASLYCFIFSCISLPVMARIIKNAMITGAMQASPSRQSNMNISATIASGVTTAPTRSGRLCARYVSVAAEDSSIIFLTLPLPMESNTPGGKAEACFSSRFLIFPATLNAAICEHMSAPIYTSMESAANKTAIQP